MTTANELLSVQRLQQKGIEPNIITLKQKAFKVDDVLKYADQSVDPDQVCKTIILTGRDSGKNFAVLLRGRDRVDLDKAKTAIGETLFVATAEQVKAAAGVEPGAVCPFSLNIDLMIDERVFELPKIHVGSGHHLHGLEVSREDLEKWADYKIVNFAK